MINYEKFWETLKKKNISQYKLINDYGISTSQINRIRKGKHITTSTLDKFCQILSCNVEDIITIVQDETPYNAYFFGTDAVAEDPTYSSDNPQKY